MRSLQSGLRTVDVARRAGYSVQQVRDLERDGVLPPVLRSPAGYRSYTAVHVQAALAYRAFAAGIGPVDAKELMRAASDCSPSSTRRTPGSTPSGGSSRWRRRPPRRSRRSRSRSLVPRTR